LNEFKELSELECNIVPGNRADRGESTMRSVLSYCGKEFKTLDKGKFINVVGWQGLKAVDLPHIGRRLVADCDVPELQLFPRIYPSLQTIRFRAGLELNLFQYALYVMSVLAQKGIVKDWTRFATILTPISDLFYYLGSDTGGMQMIMRGSDDHGKKKEITWNLLASNGDGPQIPCTPAVILSKKFQQGSLPAGARPCVEMFSLEEFMAHLAGFNIAHAHTAKAWD